MFLFRPGVSELNHHAMHHDVLLGEHLNDFDSLLARYFARPPSASKLLYSFIVVISHGSYL